MFYERTDSGVPMLAPQMDPFPFRDVTPMIRSDLERQTIWMRSVNRRLMVPVNP